MNALVTHETVQQAIDKLKASGKRPTHAAILAAIGGGSPTTLVQVMKERRQQTAAERDDEDALRAFREFWPIVTEGARKRHGDEIEEFHGAIDFLSGEVQRLDGGATAAAEALAKAESQREGLMSELTRSNDQLAALRSGADLCAKEVAQANAKTEEVRVALQREINELRERLNARETELARATEQLAAARASADLYMGRLADAAEKIEAIRTTGASETARLGMQLAHEQQKNHGIEVELARAQARLESRQAKLGKRNGKAAAVPDDADSTPA